MNKKIYMQLILIGFVFLFAGCQDIKIRKIPRIFEKNEEQTETEDTEPDIRAAFTENVTNAENTEENAESETESKNPGMITASDGTYDYVALGNSVTCSEEAEGLWWGNWGMAASSAEKDYVHLISKQLGNQFEMPVATMVLNLKKWEVAKERDAVLKKYEGYFNEHTDLVTIQTGENITEFKESLGSDYKNLLKFIKEKAPNAKILMLGELLWPSEDIESAKKAACEANGVVFIDVTEFLNDYEEVYRSAIGETVRGADKKKHKITDEVVAAHPNDEGMACIARLVMEQISVQN